MAGNQKKCKDCETQLNKDDKHSRCDECRATRSEKLKSRFKISAKVFGSISIVLGFAYLASRSSRDNLDSFDAMAFDDNVGRDTEIDVSEIPTQVHGEKYWNDKTQNWEKDGKLYTYRVTYKDVRDGEINTHEYSDVDNGYEDYEYYNKQWYTSQVEFDHVSPSEE